MFDELIQKIDEALEKLQNEDTATEGMASLTDTLKEGFSNVSEKIGEIEEMVNNTEFAAKVLNAWKQQLAEAGIEVELADESDLEKTLETLAGVQIPSQQELQEQLDAVTAERDELASKIAEAEMSARTEARLAELTEAGITIPESLTEKMTAKIRAMTDEEFAEYKQEQVELLEANKAEATEEEPDTSFAGYIPQRRGIKLQQKETDSEYDFSLLFNTQD